MPIRLAPKIMVRVGRIIVGEIQDVATPLYIAPHKRGLRLVRQSPKRYQMRP